MLYNAFQSPPKVPIPLWGYLHPMFPGPTPLSIPNYISIGSAVFAQLTAESLYALQCALKAKFHYASPFGAC